MLIDRIPIAQSYNIMSCLLGDTDDKPWRLLAHGDENSIPCWVLIGDGAEMVNVLTNSDLLSEVCHFVLFSR